MSGEVFDVRLKAPFTAVMAGPTGSGKTHTLLGLVEKAMTEDMTTQRPVEIIYCYGAWQPAFEDIDHIRFHEGVIKASDIPNDGQHRWLIIDDLMEEAMGKHETNSLFTKTSHHSNISFFFFFKVCLRKRLGRYPSTHTTSSCLRILGIDFPLRTLLVRLFQEKLILSESRLRMQRRNHTVSFCWISARRLMKDSE